MDPNAITIDGEGANEDEYERGIAAALAVFTAAGTTAYDAATAAHLRERLHEGGYYDAEGNLRTLTRAMRSRKRKLGRKKWLNAKAG